MDFGGPCSDVPVEEPVKDQVIGLGWLELWGHMASTVDSTKGEVAFIRLPVTGDLAIDHVLLPFAGFAPAKGGNPVLGTNGRHGTISVT